MPRLRACVDEVERSECVFVAENSEFCFESCEWMAVAHSERKLVVLVAIDVVEHSSLIERDETNTVASLMNLRFELDPRTKDHGGRIFNTGGDSVFAEFGRAVTVLKCAIEFQNHV